MLKNSSESLRLWSHHQQGRYNGSRSRRKCENRIASLCFLMLLLVNKGESFTHDCFGAIPTFVKAARKDISPCLHMDMINRSDSHEKEEEEKYVEIGEEDLVIGNVPGVTIDGLDWRVTRLKLEEENKKRFLRSKPRYLPYDECRKWVMAMGRWETEQEWREWIDMGEKRNAYIPARPDEYYRQLGQWKNWDHFLGKINDDDYLGEWE